MRRFLSGKSCVRILKGAKLMGYTNIRVSMALASGLPYLPRKHDRNGSNAAGEGVQQNFPELR
jgi:hypothetical protein